MSSRTTIQKELLSCLLEIAKDIMTVIEGVCKKDEEAIEMFKQLTNKDCNLIEVFCKFGNLVAKLIPFWQNADIDDPGVVDNEVTPAEIAILRMFLADHDQKK